MPRTTRLDLTPTELGALSEAVRYMQEVHADTFEGSLDPVLSRVQRKLGEDPHWE